MNDEYDFIGDELDADVDLTALIDVIFMLLIFFMVATSFIKPAVEVDLPETKSAESSGQGSGELCVITITRDGEIYFKDQKIGLDEVGHYIAQNKDARLNLYIDEAAPFKPVLTIMDEAKVHGHENLIITTKIHGE
ncbi:MAG: biopolymer transporter ExbD [Pontiella sp.]